MPADAERDGGSHLKDEDSFKGKVARYLEAKPGQSVEQVIATICDAIRYTWVFPQDAYAPGVPHTVESMTSRGYALDRLRNFWGSPEFRGISSVWRMQDDSRLFEQQYHIEESLHARELTFRGYERQRDSRTSPEEKKELRAFVREVMAAVPIPPGALGIPDYPPARDVPGTGSGGPGTTDVPAGVPRLADLPGMPGVAETAAAIPGLTLISVEHPPLYPRGGTGDMVTHYAIVDDFSSRQHPAGVVRRTVSPQGEQDEAFCRDNFSGELGWKATSLLYSAERGDLAHEFPEISQDEADQIVEQIRATLGAGNR